LRMEALEAEAKVLGMKVVSPVASYHMADTPRELSAREKKERAAKQSINEADSLKKRIAALRAQGGIDGFKISVTKVG